MHGSRCECPLPGRPDYPLVLLKGSCGVDSSGSVIAARTAGIWRKPGVQAARVNRRGGCFGLSLQPRYRGWEGRRQVLRRRHRASQLWENNPLQNGFVDAERPGDIEQDTSAETQFIEFTEILGCEWWSDRSGLPRLVRIRTLRRLKLETTGKKCSVILKTHSIKLIIKTFSREKNLRD
jgi:hypothetical protein